MERRGFLVRVGRGGLAAGVIGTAGCLAGGLGTDEYDVGMSLNAFDPDRLTVDVGRTVVWGNTSTRGHTVTAYGSALPADAAFFASGGYESTPAAREAWHASGGGDIPPGATYRHTFETPGEHPYFCIPHERAGMTGVVTVEA